MNEEKRSFCTDFDIYSTPKGAVCITFDVQRRILRAISERPRTQDELIKITGKSQSVVSTQLSRMTENKLISYERDPADARVKRFYRNSELLMSSSSTDPESEETFRRSMMISSDNPSWLFRTLLETMNMYFGNHGVNVGHVVWKQGEELAKIRIPENRRLTLMDTISLHSAYLEKAGVGKTVLISTEPVSISYSNDLDVTKTTALSYSNFFQGYYLRVVSDFYQKEFCIDSVEIYGENNEKMKMTLVPLSK